MASAPRSGGSLIIGIAKLMSVAGLCVGTGTAIAFEPTAVALAVTAVLAATLLFARPEYAVAGGIGLLPFARLEVRGLPVAELALLGGCLLLVASSLTSGTWVRNRSLVLPAWAPALLVMTLTLLLLSDLANGSFEVTTLRRFISVGGGLLLLYLVGRATVPMRLVASSAMLGITVSGAAGILKLAEGTQNGYEHRLIGFFGDPNLAGFYIVVLGTAVLGLLRGSTRLGAAAILLLLLALTQSRTSLLAAIVVTAWIVGTAGGRIVPALLMSIAIGVLAFQLPPTSITAGPFADRIGSDALRARVLDATVDYAREKPLIGHGTPPHRIPVTGLPGVTLLPHNSYLAMIGEGGIALLAAWLALLGTVLIKLVSLPNRNRYLEASLLGALVVATQLGAVLLEPPLMIALGVALHWISRERLPKISLEDVLPRVDRSVANPGAHARAS